MAGKIVYYRTAERPDIKLWLLDDDGALVDMTTASFSFKLGTPGTAAVFTKTTGITGAVGSGTEFSGTPNATLTFTAAELDAVPAGAYTWQLRTTTTSLDRVYQGMFTMLDVIT